VLEDIATNIFESPTYHLANQTRHVDVLLQMQINADGISDMLSLLRERNVNDEVEELIKGPFSPKLSYVPPQTRFSDGNLRVLYTALERETAKAEIWHRHVKPMLEGGNRRRTLYFRFAACDFSGSVKDLRPNLQDWPFLTSDDGYNRCNVLAQEASSTGLAGILTWSARIRNGTNLPVFKEVALSNPRWDVDLAFVCDPATGSITTIDK